MDAAGIIPEEDLDEGENGIEEAIEEKEGDLLEGEGEGRLEVFEDFLEKLDIDEDDDDKKKKNDKSN